DDLIGFAEQLAALRVPDDHVLDVQLGEHRRADLSRERAVAFPVTVLRAQADGEAIAVDRRLHRPQRRERRTHDDVDAVEILVFEPEPEFLHHLDRLEMRVVHLPIARHHRLANGHRRNPLRKACNPGRSPSSISSSEAPPPVDTWSMRSASPNRRTAAALSPPPTTVKPRQSATAPATVRVPAANGSSSKTPIGPFQSTVAAPAMTSA